MVDGFTQVGFYNSVVFYTFAMTIVTDRRRLEMWGRTTDHRLSTVNVLYIKHETSLTNHFFLGTSSMIESGQVDKWLE